MDSLSVYPGIDARGPGWAGSRKERKKNKRKTNRKQKEKKTGKTKKRKNNSFPSVLFFVLAML